MTGQGQDPEIEGQSHEDQGQGHEKGQRRRGKGLQLRPVHIQSQEGRAVTLSCLSSHMFPISCHI